MLGMDPVNAEEAAEIQQLVDAITSIILEMETILGDPDVLYRGPDANGSWNLGSARDVPPPRGTEAGESILCWRG